MGDPWTIIGWAVIIVGCLAGLTFIILALLPHLDQWRATRARHRADAGKLRCETKLCTKFSTHVTPNGYFCEDHEGENSKKNVLTGSVMYSQPLAHVVNRR